MSDSALYDDLIDAAIAHVRELRARGRRHVSLGPAEGSRRNRAASMNPAAVMAAASMEDEKAEAMGALQERARQCVRCPHLAASRRQVVFGVGNIHASLMFVGEAPGVEEDRQGEPFVGPAGELLTRIIQTMGLTRQSVYIANILKCRPDMPGKRYGNRKPTVEELRACFPYLREQVGLIRPAVLVALGVTAVEGLLGASGGITRLRGQWREYEGIPVMPTYHPSYLLHQESGTDRGRKEKRQVWEDMMLVMERLGMEVSEKQRGFFGHV